MILRRGNRRAGGFSPFPIPVHAEDSTLVVQTTIGKGKLLQYRVTEIVAW